MSEQTNPFIKEFYPDGDVDYNPPRWRKELDEYKARHGKVEHDSENTKDSIIKEDEIALKHPITGATVKVCDDGCIDIFAGERLGIRLDPSTNTANIFGDNINFFGKNVNFRTKPNGLIWNGYSFNPALYYEDEKENNLQLQGIKMHDGQAREVAVSPMIRATQKAQYSEGMMSILAELGLPVDDIE